MLEVACLVYARRQVLNMKPEEILSLLEEASGTRMYEKKKDGALKTLERKQAKLDEIDEVLVPYDSKH
jgi:structural maintenance of chromosome 2